VEISGILYIAEMMGGFGLTESYRQCYLCSRSKEEGRWESGKDDFGKLVVLLLGMIGLMKDLYDDVGDNVFYY
jgi:hypothetical protein